MEFTDNIRTLEKLTSVNERTKLNAVYISLNFDSSEKPDKETLQIADTYMQRIGFGNQPCLVYQPNDAGHPHIHNVTIHIQCNGKRIKLSIAAEYKYKGQTLQNRASVLR